jgi:pyridoxamine 5'-phosphate oxidase
MTVFDAESALDPLELFGRWMEAAAGTEVNDPEAVALATANAEGHPSVRMVLMKGLDQRGFAFYTNAESRKGCELAENPWAAMCFHWKTQRRQVRVEGRVRELPAEDADDYFHSRGRRSQLGAVASAQSRRLGSRAELEARAAEAAERFPGEVMRPDYWRGYVLEPERVEFWQDGADRLHDRVVFVREGGGGARMRLFP